MMVVVELWLIRILTLTYMSNFEDRNVETDGRTNGNGDVCVAKSGGQGDVSCKV